MLTPSLLLLASIVAAASPQAVELVLEDADATEQAELAAFVADVAAMRQDELAVASTKRRIESLGRFKKVSCALSSEGAVHVRCRLQRARLLREVRLEGLPLALLETDVKKRVFLRPGEAVDEDEASGKSRLLRQRQRIEELLEREGLLGAEVRLLVKKVDDQGLHDVIIRIRGGDFPRVRRVQLESWGPLSQQELTDAYGKMCLTSEGLLDGVFLGDLTSCFNRRRLQATTERFNFELVNRGYPEGRVRATPRVINAARSEDPECARTVADVDGYKKQGLPVPPLCVDIVVTVDAGPHVNARFHLPKSEPIAEMPPVLPSTFMWLFETFVEPVSRGFQIAARGEPARAEDTRAVMPRLEEALSFRAASSTDETEVEVSADAVHDYLERRGFVAPTVTVEHATVDGELTVDFYVEAVPIGAVHSLRFLGNKTLSEEEILDEVKLAAQRRSWDVAGTLSTTDLSDDERRIRDFYASRGFAEANVTARATLAPRGEIDVIFAIDEGERFLVADVQLEGGSTELTQEVLASLAQCAGGLATDEEREPVLGTDCAGAPLIVDELEADAQRVEAVYASHGFANVEAVVDTGFSPAGTVVRIRVMPADAPEAERDAPVLDNVKPARLGQIFVVGNRGTRRDVILRDVGIDEDDSDGTLDPVAIQKGVSRLRRSGLFKSVDVAYLGLTEPGERAHVRIAVDERPAFTVDSSVGFSTEELFSLQLEVRHRNVFGSMFDVSGLAGFGLFIGRFSQARVAIQWPRILGSDVSASFVPAALTYSDDPAGQRLRVPSTAAGQKVGAAWALPDDRRRLFSAGSSLSVDWRLNDLHPLVDQKLTLGLGVELRYDWLSLASPPVAPFSDRALETVDGLLFVLQLEDPTQIAALTPRVAYTNIDNPFDPRRGFAAEVFFRASPPPLVQQFYGVLGISARGYHTVWDRLTFAGGARVRAGFAAPSDRCLPEGGCEWALMQSDLLLIGGENTVRGVPENQVGVLSPVYDQRLKPVKDNNGPVVQVHPGLYSAVVNLELRYTLIRQLFIGELKPAVFADAGVSTNDFAFETNPNPDAPKDLRYATSVGVGLRYVLPVGPLSVDFAYSPTRQTYNVYLQFGYIF